jgi:hypothetical protein
LERWIGRWEGDPHSGTIMFFMTAEGEGIDGEEYVIRECSPPTRLSVETRFGDLTWHLRLELSEAYGVTTLVFAQLADDDDPRSTGPGWEYYLDRLGASLRDEDVAAIRWDDYYPAMSDHYGTLGL